MKRKHQALGGAGKLVSSLPPIQAPYLRAESPHSVTQRGPYGAFPDTPTPPTCPLPASCLQKNLSLPDLL